MLPCNGFTIINPDTCYAGLGQILLDVSSGTQPYTFDWVGTPFPNSNPITNLDTGLFTVVITDATGCFQVEKYRVPNVNRLILLDTLALSDTCLAGKGSVLITPLSGQSPYTYSWDDFAGLDTNYVDSLAAGDYPVTVTDANGCDTSITLVVPNLSNLLPSDTLIWPDTCFSGQGGITLNLDSGGSYTYQWTGGAGGNSNTLSNVGAGNYSVLVTDNNGCQQNFSFTVPNFDNYVASLDAYPLELTTLDPLCNFAELNSTSVTWNWDFGDGFGGRGQNPTHTYDTTGTFYASVIATDHNGCIDTVGVTILVKSASVLYVPEGFTPNGDHINDTWGVSGTGFMPGYFDLRIFNRWGGELWHAKHQNYRWNAKFREDQTDVPQGIYVYRLKYTDLNGDRHDKIGHIALVRME